MSIKLEVIRYAPSGTQPVLLCLCILSKACSVDIHINNDFILMNFQIRRWAADHIL